MEKQKEFKEKKEYNLMEEVGKILFFIVAFILGGTGLKILYDSGGNTVSVIGGFALIGIAIVIAYKIIEDG